MGRAVLLGLLLASSLPAADPACLDRTLPVTVMDKQGNLVEGLTAADFRGEFRGKPVAIDSLQWDIGPRRVVLAMDVSGSMDANGGMMRLARGVAVDLLTNPPANLSFALLLFSDDIVSRVDFGENRSLVAELIAPERAPKGRTAMFHALDEAVKMLGLNGTGSVVFVLTDGEDSESENKWRTVEEVLASTRSRLFGFLIPPAPLDRPDQNMLASRRILARLVESSGGELLRYQDIRPLVVMAQSIPDLTDSEKGRLAARLRQIYREMSEFYRLGVRLPREVDKGRTWKLEVVDAQGKRRKDLIVLYPQRLFPCEAAGAAKR